MQALTDRLDPYTATRISRRPITGLWSALSRVVGPTDGLSAAAFAGDAPALPPDPVSDARMDEICAEEAQRAIFTHLAILQASEPAGAASFSV